jgi:BASS family bile acid:Na+ symporter
MEIAKTIAPFCLIIIMFGLGLGLTVTDFKRLTKYPSDFIVGFFGQVILLPIVAFILIHIISLSPELALGTMLIAAAPGGVMSNILTKFANGDVALSVSLTAIISLISVITVPFIIFNSAAFLDIEIGKEISMLNIALKMFVAVTVPVI